MKTRSTGQLSKAEIIKIWEDYLASVRAAVDAAATRAVV